ncbi:hypothetical protein [Kaistia algarum]|nr:hypothetical protein [Kaistia algarum]MCX5515752.1 hypothetical protein [Kaistia algarum]
MSIPTVARIDFRGRARPALSFQRSVFGGELLLAHAQVWILDMRSANAH